MYKFKPSESESDIIFHGQKSPNVERWYINRLPLLSVIEKQDRFWIDLVTATWSRLGC